MLKQGTFIDRKGEVHTIFVLESKGFYRMDIMQEGANFQTDVAAVEFSIVKKRKTFTFGNIALYEDFKELRDISIGIKCPIDKSSEWKDGKYYTKSVQSKEDIGFLQETIQCNSIIESVALKYGDRFYTLFTIADYSNMKLDPINFMDYEEDVLDPSGSVTFDTPYYPLNILRARYDIAHIEKKDFVVADTIEVARERLRRYDKAVVQLRGFDTETTGLDVDLYGEDKMTGIIISFSEDESTYYPFRHAHFPNLPMEFLPELMEVIIRHEDTTVAHNGKFDRKVMKKEGYDLRCKWDTMILSFMVNPIIERGAHALKNLMLKLDGKKYLELEEIFTSPKLIDFSVLPKDIVRVYACPDGSNVITLFKYLYAKLPKHTRNIFEVECDLAHVKADQEYFGLKVNVKEFMKNLDNCDYVLDKLTKAFRQLTRIDGNINSSAVLSDLMYNKMRCPVLLRTKTGKASTGAKAVKKLAKVKGDTTSNYSGDIVDKFGKVIVKGVDLSTAKYPALVILEKYRIYVKLRTAFYSRFERTVKYGRIFFWVNQNGATSGRQSSPMHQLPPELKAVIVPDDDNVTMWDPDYSQIELRMIAYLANEVDLIEMCRDPENDIHRAIGSLISGKEMWQISGEERKRDKTRNFGVVYLISEFGLSNQMFGAGASSDKALVARAKQSLDEFYARFKRIRAYVAKNADIVKRDGFISTRFGRNRLFHEIFDPDISSARKASLIRQANNTPVQGTAADILKIAEVNFDAYIRNHGWDEIMENGFPKVRLALSIHDEVILMAHESIPYEEILLMVRTCMEIDLQGAPPFFVSPAKVDTWAQHDDDSVVVPVLLRDKLIKDYQDTGVSAINKENYMNVLNSYRDSLLNDYMHSLIAQYGTDAEVVSQHVRHATLTHELIARYKQPKNADMSHEEHIEYATKLYIEGVDTSSLQHYRESISDKENEFVLEDLDVLVNFDANGEVIFENPDDEDEMYVPSVFDDEHYVMTMTSGEIIKVWELGDAMCVDVNELELEAVDRVISELWKYKDDNGFFKVLLYYNGGIVDTKFRVEDIPKSEITKLIETLSA